MYNFKWIFFASHTNHAANTNIRKYSQVGLLVCQRSAWYIGYTNKTSPSVFCKRPAPNDTPTGLNCRPSVRRCPFIYPVNCPSSAILLGDSHCFLSACYTTAGHSAKRLFCRRHVSILRIFTFIIAAILGKQ